MGTHSLMMASRIIENFPCFAPSTYQHWKRELRLRMAGFPTSTVSQFLSKIIAVLPPPAKITGMSYMEATDTAPHMRTVDALITMMDERYAKTDTDRPWAWLGEFTTFAKKPAENLKDFRARLLRVATRLEALGAKMSASVISPQALQALKLSDWRLPIALSALGTKPNSHSFDSRQS